MRDGGGRGSSHIHRAPPVKVDESIAHVCVKTLRITVDRITRAEGSYTKVSKDTTK